MTENMEARIKEIIADPKLTYPQRLIELARRQRTFPTRCLSVRMPGGLWKKKWFSIWGRGMRLTVRDMCCRIMICL